MSPLLHPVDANQIAAEYATETRGIIRAEMYIAETQRRQQMIASKAYKLLNMKLRARAAVELRKSRVLAALSKAKPGPGEGERRGRASSGPGTMSRSYYLFRCL